MPIVINPSTSQEGTPGLPLCFTASATASIPGEELRNIDVPSSGTNYSYDPVSGIWHKSGGGNGIYNALTMVSAPIYAQQPFYIEGANTLFNTPGGSNNNHSVEIGVIGDDGKRYRWEVLKYCNATPGNCGSNWLSHCRFDNIDLSFTPVNLNEIFRLRSDGLNFIYERKTGGAWTIHATTPLPPTVKQFYFYVDGAYINNTINLLHTWKGSYQGTVPITWSVVGDGTLTGNSSYQRCFSADALGTYGICVDSDFDEPTCVDISLVPLYFEPVDIECGQCVLADTIVSFTSNAGQSGLLSATGGTVLDNLTWQAPTTAGSYVLSYTFDEVTIDCLVNVVAPIQMLNVLNNRVSGVLPGESFTLRTNYPQSSIYWECLEMPGVISADGHFTAPDTPWDGCFGAYSLTVTGKVADFGGIACVNLMATPPQITIKIEVAPCFPLPVFCGPRPTKWLRHIPEYKVVVSEMEGGCDETHLKSRVGIYRWTIEYRGLPYQAQVVRDYYGHELPCCCSIHGPGCHNDQAHAKRLDDFWIKVRGTSGFFTLIDYETGLVWRNVRIEERPEQDFTNRITTHSRTYRLKWAPCCAAAPVGENCSRHGGLGSDDNPPPGGGGGPGGDGNFLIEGGDYLVEGELFLVET